MVVAAASAADVTDVVVGGRHVVRGGAHVDLDVAADLRAAIRAVALTWDLLLTGRRRARRVAVEGDRIAWVGSGSSLPRGPTAPGGGTSRAGS